MKGYSRSRYDFIQKLAKKYQENPVYSVTKDIMKEAIYIEWESCSKCMMMKPHVQKWSEENWYELQVIRFDDISAKEFEIQSVPMLVLKEDWEVKEILNEEWIVHLISNK